MPICRRSETRSTWRTSYAIHPHLPLADIIEARDQVDQAGLARAGRADQGDHLVRLARAGRYPPARRPSRPGIGSRPARNSTCPVSAGSGTASGGDWIAGTVSRISKAALHAGHRFTGRVDQPGELLGRAGQQQQIAVEGHQLADGHLAAAAPSARRTTGSGWCPAATRKWVVGMTLANALTTRTRAWYSIAVCLCEALDLIRLAGKGAHHLHPADILLQAGGQVTQGADPRSGSSRRSAGQSRW